MANLDPYKPTATNYDFSKGPKEVYNAAGDEGLFDVVLNIPQDDTDDEWGGTERIGFERIIDAIGQINLDLYDPFGSGTQGLLNKVGKIERVVQIGATIALDTIHTGSTVLAQDALTFGGTVSPTISTTGVAPLKIQVIAGVYEFGAAFLSLPAAGGISHTGTTLQVVTTGSLSLSSVGNIILTNPSSTTVTLSTSGKLAINSGSTGITINNSINYTSASTADVLKFIKGASPSIGDGWATTITNDGWYTTTARAGATHYEASYRFNRLFINTESQSEFIIGNELVSPNVYAGHIGPIKIACPELRLATILSNSGSAIQFQDAFSYVTTNTEDDILASTFTPVGTNRYHTIIRNSGSLCLRRTSAILPDIWETVFTYNSITTDNLAINSANSVSVIAQDGIYLDGVLKSSTSFISVNAVLGAPTGEDFGILLPSGGSTYGSTLFKVRGHLRNYGQTATDGNFLSLRSVQSASATFLEVVFGDSDSGCRVPPYSVTPGSNYDELPSRGLYVDASGFLKLK